MTPIREYTPVLSTRTATRGCRTRGDAHFISIRQVSSDAATGAFTGLPAAAAAAAAAVLLCIGNVLVRN